MVSLNVIALEPRRFYLYGTRLTRNVGSPQKYIGADHFASLRYQVFSILSTSLECMFFCSKAYRKLLNSSTDVVRKS